eukprot:scaffold26371_cov57-Phaeocystis_antarctica.AAC.1
MWPRRCAKVTAVVTDAVVARERRPARSMRTHRSESRRAGEEGPFAQVLRGQQTSLAPAEGFALQWHFPACYSQSEHLKHYVPYLPQYKGATEVTPEQLFCYTQAKSPQRRKASVKAKLQIWVADLPPRHKPVEIKGVKGSPKDGI